MEGHVFRTLIFYAPAAMVDGFIPVCFTNAAVPFSGAVCVCASAIGMHAIEEIRDIIGRRDVDMSESSVTFKIL